MEGVLRGHYASTHGRTGTGVGGRGSGTRERGREPTSEFQMGKVECVHSWSRSMWRKREGRACSLAARIVASVASVASVPSSYWRLGKNSLGRK